MSQAVPGICGGTNIIITLSELPRFKWGHTLDNTTSTALGNINNPNIFNGIAADSSGNIALIGTIGNSNSFSISTKDSFWKLIDGKREAQFTNGISITSIKINGQSNISTNYQNWESRSIDISNSINEGKAIVFDNSNNICITGYIINNDISNNIYYFYGGGMLSEVNTRIRNVGQGIYIARLRPFFNQLPFWYRIIDSSGVNGGDEVGNGIVTDKRNNITVIGNISGSTTIIDNSNTIIATRTNTNKAIIIVQYNTNGIFRWSKIIESDMGLNNGNSITSDNNNNIYITGYINGSTIYEDNSIIVNRSSLNTGILIAKYDMSGSFIWRSILDSSGIINNTNTAAIKADSSGNVYITANIIGQTVKDNSGNIVASRTANSGQGILFVKYNTNGVLQWTRIIDSSNNSLGINSNSTSGNNIAIDKQNNVYITGTVCSNNSTIVKDNSNNIIATRLRSDLGSGMLVAKYNSNGEFIDGNTIDTSWNNYNNNGYGIHVDTSYNIFVAGSGLDFSASIIINNNNNIIVERGAGTLGTSAIICKLSMLYSTFISSYNISSGIIDLSWNIAYESIKPSSTILKYNITQNNTPILVKYSDISYRFFNELSYNDISYIFNLTVFKSKNTLNNPITLTTTTFVPGYVPQMINTFIPISPIEISFNFYLFPSMNQYVNGIILTYKPTLTTISDSIILLSSLVSGTALGNNSIYTDRLIPDTSYNKIVYNFNYNIRGLTTGNIEQNISFRTPTLYTPRIIQISSITSNSVKITFDISNYNILLYGNSTTSFTMIQTNLEGNIYPFSILYDPMNTQYNCFITNLESDTSFNNKFKIRALYKYGHIADTVVSDFRTLISPIVITLVEPTANSVKISWVLKDSLLGTLESQQITGTDVILYSSDSNSITISGLTSAKIYNDWQLSTTFTNSNGAIITLVKQFATLVDFAAAGSITPKIYIDAQYFSNTISGLNTTKDTSYRLSNSNKWVSQYNSATISGSFGTEGDVIFPTYNNDGSYSYIQFNGYNDDTSGNYLEFGSQQFDMSTNNGITIIGVVNMNGMQYGSIFNLGEKEQNNIIYGNFNGFTYISNFMIDQDNNFIEGYAYNYNTLNNWFIISIKINRDQYQLDSNGNVVHILYKINNTVSYIAYDGAGLYISDLPLFDTNFTNINIGRNIIGDEYTIKYGTFKIREMMFFDGGLDDTSISNIENQLLIKYNII